MNPRGIDTVPLAGIADTFSNAVLTGPLLLGMGAAMLAGLISFASPCVVPLVPGYLSYLAGVVGAEAPPVSPDEPAKQGRLRVLGAAGLFVLGFTVVYVLVTVAVFETIGNVVRNDLELMQRIGGVITIVMGLVFLGLIPFLQRDVRFSMPRRKVAVAAGEETSGDAPAGDVDEERKAPRRVVDWIGAPLLGAVFAVGWIPCTSATLSAVLSVAISSEGVDAYRAVLLVVAFCLGLGIPFLILALGSAWALRSLGFLRRNARTIQIIGGVLMIVVGVLLLTGAWNEFVLWIQMKLMNDVVLPI